MKHTDSADNHEFHIRLYSKAEASKLIGIGKSNLNELITSGRLGFIVIGKRVYIPLIEPQKFIERKDLWQAYTRKQTYTTSSDVITVLNANLLKQAA